MHKTTSILYYRLHWPFVSRHTREGFELLLSSFRSWTHWTVQADWWHLKLAKRRNSFPKTLVKRCVSVIYWFGLNVLTEWDDSQRAFSMLVIGIQFHWVKTKGDCAPEEDQSSTHPELIITGALQHFNVTVKCFSNSCRSPLIQLHWPSLYNASPSCCVCANACVCVCVFLAQSVIQSGLACCERQHCCRGTDVETRTSREADGARNSRSQRDKLLTSVLILSFPELFILKNCAVQQQQKWQKLPFCL